MTSEKYPYIHRDISWLDFNYRVLQEARSKDVPLLERIKFMAIYSSNLDEYFRVRVANHRNLVRVGKKTKKKLDYEPEEMLKQITAIVNKQQLELSEIQSGFLDELKSHGINILRRHNLNDEQRTFIEEYFSEYMLPFVQPVLLLKGKINPFLNNAALYLVIDMTDMETKLVRYGLVQIPSNHLPRFLEIPSKKESKRNIMILDDVVRHNFRALFPGYEIRQSHSIKLTRDAELYIDDEFSGDLIQKIKRSLNKRNVGPASRLVYDRKANKDLIEFLKESFKLKDYDMLPEGRYHNNSDFMNFPSLGKLHLKDPPLPPLAIPILEDGDIFEKIREQDHLVHVPYHSYESVVRFFEQAAKDPNVTHIKVVQYRVSRKSRIMNALIQAAKSGKNVSVFIEVKARFDEEANLKWGERLEAAGATVNYSFPGLKVHSKTAMVRRVVKGKPEIYSYLSTGNFHEGTAKIYSDLGIFTFDKRYTKEIVRLFYFLETVKIPKSEFKHLLVGQFNLRNSLEEKIFREISNAKKGHPAQIILKLNSLQDKKMINFLYEASQNGVEVILIVRGLCSLVAGKKGVSENIQTISIVDRFLEHARIYIFHNKGKEEMYLSSADWMERNLSHRIETAFPIYEDYIKETIFDLIDLQLTDNVKARSLNHKEVNKFKKRKNKDVPIRSQVETYYYLKRQLEQEAEDEK